MIRIAVAVAVLTADPPRQWRLERESDGVKVEVREVQGSSFQEIRITTQSRLPLGSLCDAVWGKDAKVEGDFKKRVVIRESDNERWTYEQVRVPLVKDRDLVMRARLVATAATGRCELQFESADDPAYPATSEHVRIPKIRGSWELQPLGDGRIVITYVIYSEPGGAVPALFARGSQRDAAVGFMKQILARATK